MMLRGFEAKEEVRREMMRRPEEGDDSADGGRSAVDGMLVQDCIICTLLCDTNPTISTYVIQVRVGLRVAI